MNNISIDELEKKVEAGEEVIDTYFESKTTRIETPHQVISRRRSEHHLATNNLKYEIYCLENKFN